MAFHGLLDAALDTNTVACVETKLYRSAARPHQYMRAPMPLRAGKKGLPPGRRNRTSAASTTNGFEVHPQSHPGSSRHVIKEQNWKARVSIPVPLAC